VRPGGWLSALLVAAVLLLSGLAAAQDPYGPGLSPGMSPGMGPGMGPPPGHGKKKPAPTQPSGGEGEPELHAAGGGESLIPEGTEPTLPDEPLAISDDVRERIGSSLNPDDRYIGPRDRYRLRTAFPLWVERRKPSLTDPTKTDRASLFGPLYYNRRSAEHQHDVLFPIFWNLRDGPPGSRERTTIVGPFVNRRAGKETDDWLLPFYARGKRPGGGYTLVPPLLTYTERHASKGFTLAGPAFCKWEGGASCDARTAQRLRLGIAPFYFFGQDRQKKFETIPPLLHHYSYNDRDLSYTNVWGPYFRRHKMRSEDGKLHDWDMFHLLPIYWSMWAPGERHTTVLPLFHYGHKQDAWLFINPLFLAARGKDADRTFVTWGYARYRGRTSLDMYTPLVWKVDDPDIGMKKRLVLPFWYSKLSPRERTRALFPLYARRTRFELKQTTWVTPFVQHSTHLRGWTTNLHPILYLGRNGHQSHTVVAPLFWDFVGREERATVGFPFFWRFTDAEGTSELVGNVYYRERQGAYGTHWQIHLFPLFAYGKTPDGHWWNLLYGLAGYKRAGDWVRVRALWAPITLSGSSE